MAVPKIFTWRLQIGTGWNVCDKLKLLENWALEGQKLSARCGQT